jgi:hypothetical protein
MKNKTVLFLFLLLFLYWAPQINARFHLQFVVLANTGASFDVKVQIQADTAFNMGGANLVFTYNSSALGVTVSGSPPNVQGITPHAFTSGPYQPMTVTRPVANRISINIVYDGGIIPPAAVPVGTWMDVVTIHFETLQPAGFSNIIWRTSIPNRVVVYDDQNNWVHAGNLLGNDYLLPVDMHDLEAERASDGIRLGWKAAVKSDHRGFEIYRTTTLETSSAWSQCGFLPAPYDVMAGEREFHFTDQTAPGGCDLWYRLRSVDNDGDMLWSPVLHIESGRPPAFLLEPLYPNPASSGIVLPVSTAAEGTVHIALYDQTGRASGRAVQRVLPAGYHCIEIPVHDLPAGRYFCMIRMNGQTQLRSLTVMH